MEKKYMVVETDNFGGDYPNEKFATPYFLRKEIAEKIATILNEEMSGDKAPRYWMVREEGYKLLPGFEP